MSESDYKDLNDLPELMREEVAANFLGKSTTTMWRLRKEARISYRRMGAIYYLREDIREFLDRNKCPAE
jgi:hypothetical protein